MIRASVRASNITISITKPENTSTVNIFKGKILNIKETGGPCVLVHCDIGAPIAAQISKASCVRPGLRAGKNLYLPVKVVSIIY